MKYTLTIALAIGLAIAVELTGCSLFQPAATAPVAPATCPAAQVVQKTVACMQSSVMPCLTQAGAAGNPQLCFAMASFQCAAAN